MSQRTMNSAIIAVTKSAYATFQAPPVVPPMSALLLDDDPMIHRLCFSFSCRHRCRRARTLAGLLHLQEAWTYSPRYGSPPEFQRLYRSVTLYERQQQHTKHLVIVVLLVGSLRHV